MIIQDIHPESTESILLLHPMLATGELMRTLLADPLGETYHYLIPDIAGHGEASDQVYVSAEQEAQEIHAYLKAHQITNIRLAFGASLGGVILLELLRTSDVRFETILFEGVSMQEDADWTEVFTKWVLLRKHKRAVANPDLAVEKMRQLYGEQAAQTMAEQMVSIREESLKHMIRDCSHVRLPELSLDQQSKCIFAYGEKDGSRKAAGKLLPKRYPQAKQIIWPGCGHCTKMTEDQGEYVRMLRTYL